MEQRYQAPAGVLATATARALWELLSGVRRPEQVAFCGRLHFGVMLTFTPSTHCLCSSV
jgi:hypothetical protein